MADRCYKSCPSGYRDDGLLCAKDSYGRGAGSPMDDCPDDRSKDGALCYKKCKSDYKGEGPVCWERCPDGYKDDGATCRRDAKVISADNDKCPWYDKCGTTKKCAKCPDGYKRDGCLCRRDADINAKDSYGRGAGTPLTCGSRICFRCLPTAKRLPNFIAVDFYQVPKCGPSRAVERVNKLWDAHAVKGSILVCR